MATKQYLDAEGLKKVWGEINKQNKVLVGSNADDQGKSIREIANAVFAGTINGAQDKYDTLIEIAEWIQSDAAGAGAAKDLEDLKTTVNDSTTGLAKKVSDLETTVGGTSSGLVKDVNDINTALGSEGTVTNGNRTGQSGIKGSIADLQDNIGTVVTAVKPLADTVVTLKNNLGEDDADGTGTTAFDRIKALENVNANADTIEAIPVNKAATPDGNSIEEICVFSYT